MVSDPTKVIFEKKGASSIHIEADFDGTIVAPKAQVEVLSGTTFRGQIAADSVVIHQEATFEFAPFEGSWFYQCAL